MKLKRFVFDIVSYVMHRFSFFPHNGGTSHAGSRDNFKC